MRDKRHVYGGISIERKHCEGAAIPLSGQQKYTVIMFAEFRKGEAGSAGRERRVAKENLGG